MAPKANKPKGKGRPEETSVMASLSSTRPTRLSRRERSSAAPPTRKAAAAGRAQPKATKAAAKPVAAAEPAAAAKPVAAPEPARPRPVRAGSRALAEANKKSAGKRLPADPQPPSGTDLVSTVVQAAGELAQVGLTVGGQILKRAVEKLPKP